MPHAAEVHVVAALFGLEKGLHGMVEVVGPLCMEAISSELAGSDHADVIEVALGNEIEPSPDFNRPVFHILGKRLQKRTRAGVINAVNCIEAEAVHMKVREPVQCILDKVSPHLVAVRPVKVDGVPPWRFVLIGEVRAELPDVASLRARNDCTQRREPRPVPLPWHAFTSRFSPSGPPYEFCTAYGYAPSYPQLRSPGKLGNRHKFDCIDPGRGDGIKTRDDRIESPFRRERADV